MTLSHYDKDDLWRCIIKHIKRRKYMLPGKEQDLVNNWDPKISKGDRPSPKVAVWLLDIARRLPADEHAIEVHHAITVLHRALCYGE